MAKRGRRKGDSGKKWTDDDLNFLKNMYMFFTDEELSKILGRAPKTIHSIRRKYGWFKTKKLKNMSLDEFVKNVPIIFVHRREEYDNDRLRLDEVLFTND